jgi:hypothetical protein
LATTSGTGRPIVATATGGATAAIQAACTTTGNGSGIIATGIGTGVGVVGTGGNSFGVGVFGQGGTDGDGVVGTGDGDGVGLKATAGADAAQLRLVARTPDPTSEFNGDIVYVSTGGVDMMWARMYNTNQPIVGTRANVTTNGTGGATINSEFNVSGYLFVGNDIKLTFKRSFLDANFAVAGSVDSSASGFWVQVISRFTNTVTVGVWRDDGAHIDLTTTALTLSVTVDGEIA